MATRHPRLTRGRGPVALLLTAALLTGNTTVFPASSAADTTDPTTDRTRVVLLWRYGGPVTKDAAAKALTGSDADVHAFLATGHQQTEQIDHRLLVNQVMAAGGPTIKSTAQTALDANSDQALTAFLSSGWRQPWQTDQRVRINQIMATGGAEVRKAGQQALDANSVDALTQFLDSGWRVPWDTDQRVRVNQIMTTGGAEVKKAAQQALDANSADALTQFIQHDWAIAQARDQETASVSQLAAAAADAGEQAAQQTQAAKEAADQADAAAAKAKQAAKDAKDAAIAAQGKAGEAASAASKAADAAQQAAQAARVAISASNAANNAAQVAASAAGRAATAASMAAQAAAHANDAAAAAAEGSGTAEAARQAAIAARAIEQQARAAADAAAAAGDAAVRAGTAAQAANDAVAQSNSAADYAKQAAGYAHDSGADANEATAAANTAQANAARAARAANAAATLANQAAQYAGQARTAANQAADFAEAAAKAADEAADEAGHAIDAAKKALDHAKAARDAADAATAAANQAQQVYQAARDADAIRLATEAEQADTDAKQALATTTQQQAQKTWDTDQAALRDAETNRLITEANTAGADPALVVADGRKIALNLASSGGPWTRTAATTALSGSDAVVTEFVHTGIQTAAGQDDRDVLADLALTATPSMQTAIKTVLAGSDAGVREFLRTRDYDGRAIDDRVQVNQIMSAARQAGRTVVVQAAQKALDANSDQALRQFLTVDQYIAAAQDDRVKVNQVMAAGGPEVKAAAQAALDGPTGLLHQFLQVGQFAAAQRDQDTASHNTLVAGLVVQAMETAETANENAYDAQAAALRANNDVKDATAAAAEANAAAGRAAAAATQAHNSAVQAENSARDAATSARTAQTAAAAAQAAAQRATNLAVRAQADASSASRYAASAYDAAMSAYNSAIAAKKSSQEATQAYDDARKDALAKGQAEKADAEQKWIAACKDKNPDTDGQLYKDCVLLGTGSESDRNWVLYTRGTACTIFNQEGSQAFKECTAKDNLFSPDFSASPELLHALEKIATVVISMEIGLTFATGLTVLSIAAPFVATVLTGILLSIVPEGMAFLPLLLPAAGLLGGAEVAGLLNDEALSASLEQAMVENEALDAETAEQASQLADRGIPRIVCEPNSFAPGTPVLLADGTKKAIKDITVGDRVLNAEPGSNTQQVHAVDAVHLTDTDRDFVDLTVGSGQLTTTAHHLFWDRTSGTWERAVDLKAGDQLQTPGGTTTVASSRAYASSGRTFNLTIDTVHTFYVLAGDTAVLVHNENICPHLDMSGVPEELRDAAQEVIRSMDTDGVLPPDVRQGGQRGLPGIYGGEGLPPEPPRYYVETDILPTPPGGTRPESGRLVFGARGEVWYTGHYKDGFIQLRGAACGC